MDFPIWFKWEVWDGKLLVNRVTIQMGFNLYVYTRDSVFPLKFVFGVDKMNYCEKNYAKTRRTEGIHQLARIQV